MNPFFRSFLFGIYGAVLIIVVSTIVAKLVLNETAFQKYIDIYFDYNLPLVFLLVLCMIRYSYIRRGMKSDHGKN